MNSKVPLIPTPASNGQLSPGVSLKQHLSIILLFKQILSIPWGVYSLSFFYAESTQLSDLRVEMKSLNIGESESMLNSNHKTFHPFCFLFVRFIFSYILLALMHGMYKI